jgi:hypothetical protein
MTKKIELGQFFTRKDSWLKPHIYEFIRSIKFNTIIDPFAGEGHLIKIFEPEFKINGYDIDQSLSWPINDGLVGIPNHPVDLCVTNPPYLNKGTAKRFNRSGILHYFTTYPEFDDLYLMGLSQCLKSFPYGVAIIPETYLLHSKKSKRITSATILEENPFEDTEFPVVVITWGPEDQSDYKIYKDDKFIGSNNELMKKIPTSTKIEKDTIKFNVIEGNLGIVCIDKGNTIGGIKFTLPDKITGPIKHSSRTSTKVMISANVDIDKLIQESNELLKIYREETADVFMAPFKGNDQNGERRRRLDFTTARLIIENALAKLGYSKKKVVKPVAKKNKINLVPLFDEDNS